MPAGLKLSPSVYAVFVGGFVTARPVSLIPSITVIGVVAVLVTPSSVYLTVISVTEVVSAPVGLYVQPVTIFVEPSEYVAVTSMPAGLKYSPSVYASRAGGSVTSIFESVGAGSVSVFVRLT